MPSVAESGNEKDIRPASQRTRRAEHLVLQQSGSEGRHGYTDWSLNPDKTILKITTDLGREGKFTPNKAFAPDVETARSHWQMCLF
jgi:hypothetical protein